MSEHRDDLTTSDIADSASRRGHEEERETATQDTGRELQQPLFSDDDGGRLRSEWDAVQNAFVDDPRAAVARADELVARTIQNLAESFSSERGRLEDQWDQGQDVSTEDLRVALQRYRSFFDRLLNL